MPPKDDKVIKIDAYKVDAPLGTKKVRDSFSDFVSTPYVRRMTFDSNLDSGYNNDCLKTHGHEVWVKEEILRQRSERPWQAPGKYPSLRVQLKKEFKRAKRQMFFRKWLGWLVG